MKTKEFIEQVEAYGYRIEDYESSMAVLSAESDNVIMIAKDSSYAMDSNWIGMKRLTDGEREKIYSLAVEYVTTPLEEREDREYVVRRNNNTYLFRLSIEENKDRFSAGTTELAKASKFNNRDVAEKVAELANLLSFRTGHYEVVDVKDL